MLPSLFTVGNMLCGFAAVLYAIHGQLERAGWLIILAGLLDGLDGRIARLTHSTSEFGKEYDSLADVVSFGIAPAILAYQWGLRGRRPVGLGGRVPLPRRRFGAPRPLQRQGGPRRPPLLHRPADPGRGRRARR